MLAKFLVTLFTFSLFSSTCFSHGTEVSKRMHKVEDNLKLIRRDIRKGKFSTAIPRVEKIVTWTKESQGLKPGSMKLIPVSEREAYFVGYKKELSLVLNNYAELELALKASDGGKATAIIKALFDTKRKSHKTYNKLPDDDHLRAIVPEKN